MAPPSRAPSEPLLRIHAVADLTGVPEPTLRAWERRYGIPSPVRTASGYRLYGPREIGEVREMRRLCEGGLAAAEAATLVRAKAEAAVVAAEPASPAPPAPTFPTDGYAAAVEALLDAVARFDDDALDETLRRVMFLGTPLMVLERVLRPALHSIGAMWEAGEISVAQEHLASHRIGTFMRESLRFSPGANAQDRVLLACFADDEHELGMVGVAMRLSEWGLRPVILGARTPPSAIAAAVNALSPRLVALSITIAPDDARLRELCRDYARACGSVPWLVGGAAASSVAAHVEGNGGVLVPPSTDALKEMVLRLMGRAPKLQGPKDK